MSPLRVFLPLMYNFFSFESSFAFFSYLFTYRFFSFEIFTKYLTDLSCFFFSIFRLQSIQKARNKPYDKVEIVTEIIILQWERYTDVPRLTRTPLY